MKISSSATGDKCEIENVSVNSSKILNSNIRNQSENRSIQVFDIPDGDVKMLWNLKIFNQDCYLKRKDYRKCKKSSLEV